MAETLKERLARLAAEKSNTVAQPSPTKVDTVEQSNTTGLEELAKAEAQAQEEFAKQATATATASSSTVDLDALLDAPMGKTNALIAEDAAIVTADIVPRIRQLTNLSDADLESEMKLLKNALMANPEAVALMLPTDVGELVKGLRRITREAVINEATKKTTKTKAPKVDAKTMWETEADDF